MIEFKNVTKIYKGGHKANSDISFTLAPGEVLGIIGVNGSGKSTLFRQLFKIISTTEGTITVDGKTNALNSMAYVPQFPVIYPYLKVQESLEIALNYQKVNNKEAKRRSIEILEKLNMIDIKNKYTYMLSGGQKKKLSFANALVQNKKYLVLDEVTSMIDIVSKQEIWEQINEVKKDKGVLISSHDLSEIKNVCDKILILKNGEVTYSGSINDIYSQVCKITVKIDEIELLAQYLNEIKVDFKIQNSAVNIYVEDMSYAAIIIAKINAQFKVKYLNCEQPVFYEGVLKYV